MGRKGAIRSHDWMRLLRKVKKAGNSPGFREVLPTTEFVERLDIQRLFVLYSYPSSLVRPCDLEAREMEVVENVEKVRDDSIKTTFTSG